MSSRARRYVRTSGSPFRRVGDRIIVAPARSDGFEILEGTSVAVWSLLDEPRTAAELVEMLCRRFRAAPEDVDRDVRTLLRRLRRSGTVEAVGTHG